MIETYERSDTLDDVYFDAFLLEVNAEAESHESGRRAYTSLELARRAFKRGRELGSYDLAAEAFRNGCFAGVFGGLVIASVIVAGFNWLRG